MSDLVGNPEDRFSQNEAHITSGLNIQDFHYLSKLETDVIRITSDPNVPESSTILSQQKNKGAYLMIFDDN